MQASKHTCMNEHMNEVCMQRIVHLKRGAGFVAAIDPQSLKPITIKYENGEQHSYSLSSAKKLQRSPNSFIDQLCAPGEAKRYHEDVWAGNA